MNVLIAILILIPAALFGYTYVGYPLLLRLLTTGRRPMLPTTDPDPWPVISISLPAYNEEASIGRTIESLLALDYPPDRRQIIVVSDASTDRTDEIVRSYADRGVELVRMAERGGKTAAENTAAARLRGDIVVNTDATIRILPGALKPLVRAFQDPTIGVASGRDMSVGDVTSDANSGESGYVGYEMYVRDLETRFGSIIGASGCFYAIRRELHQALFPEALSRDFASALISREHGLRAVSVRDAVCLVPRAPSLQVEFRRKVRTMARGLDTLWYKRHLLNPFRYGRFAWMLASHKLARWLVFLTLPLALLGLFIWSLESMAGKVALGLAALGALAGVAGVRWPKSPPPRLLGLAGFILASHVAGFLAWLKALRGERNPIWEPTRRS